MKFVETTYGALSKNILKYPDHYVAISRTVSDVGITANADGKTIMPAGSVLGGGFLVDETVPAVIKNDAAAEGILLEDLDLTYGPASAAIIIHGFIDSNKLPQVLDATAITALKGRITFID